MEPIAGSWADRLDALDDYLSSDRAPPDCMDLSELDGFLAGIVASPVSVPANEWMPVIWDGGRPVFADDVEELKILGAILSRYEEIATGLDSEPPYFSPIFWEGSDGKPLVADWAYGFMRAVALRADAWDPVMRDEDTSVLLMPIGFIAGLAVEDLDEDDRLPDAAMEELLEDADVMLAACTVGLRAFWRKRAGRRRQSQNSRRKRLH